jgi:hypothetical protein
MVMDMASADRGPVLEWLALGAPENGVCAHVGVFWVWQVCV